jgi:hypothetical protein
MNASCSGLFSTMRGAWGTVVPLGVALLARSGNTLSVEDGTLVGADGSDALVGGTTTVNMGPNTRVTVFGQGATEINSLQQVSVGSSIDAFGVATSQSSGTATLDASAVGQYTASTFTFTATSITLFLNN